MKGLASMSTQRLAGVLLHPTSLPGGHGCGGLGEQANIFLDKLHQSGLTVWQMLPLNPTGGANSPYQTLSSFAGNPNLISLDGLVEDGLLQASDLRQAPKFPEHQVDFDLMQSFRNPLLEKAAHNFQQKQGKRELQDEFQAFRETEKTWLDDYALYRALKNIHNNAAWYTWPKPIRQRQSGALAEATLKYNVSIEREKFCQWLFFRQWAALRRKAAQYGIKLIGDIPIYVAHDSADVWAAPDLFHLDSEGQAVKLAGVPPDYFSPTGQLWGNPIYRWDIMAKDNYSWWVRRVKATLSMVDMLRIDHFRAFESYWEVKAGAKTAEIGKWIIGPGKAFFAALRQNLGENLPIFAEDLGTITPAVHALLKSQGLPGMKVLQFAFCDGAEAYLPHMYDHNCVVYTATHDNDTTRGWYAASGADYAHMDQGVIARERDKCRRYLARDGHDIAWDLIRLAMQSVAYMAIFPVQDLLDLGNDCRMNRPGISAGQWKWRLSSQQLADLPTGRMRELVWLYNRQPLEHQSGHR